MNLIAIGKILKPIGIKGKVKILPFADDIQRFTQLDSVWIGKDSKTTEKKSIFVESIETNKIIAQIENVNSANEAEKILNQFIFTSEEKIIQLKKGSYFIHDVIGCEVITETQMRVGFIKDVFSLSTNDVWVIDSNGKEILIPAVKEIIKHVDLKIKRVTINAIEGLLT